VSKSKDAPDLPEVSDCGSAAFRAESLWLSERAPSLQREALPRADYEASLGSFKKGSRTGKPEAIRTERGRAAKSDTIGKAEAASPRPFELLTQPLSVGGIPPVVCMFDLVTI
jgi:hypothetical protein